MKKSYYFTFGYGHSPGPDYYVKITALSMMEARTEMFRRYGSEWAFCYKSAEEAGVSRHGLKELFWVEPEYGPSNYYQHTRCDNADLEGCDKNCPSYTSIRTTTKGG